MEGIEGAPFGRIQSSSYRGLYRPTYLDIQGGGILVSFQSTRRVRSALPLLAQYGDTLPYPIVKEVKLSYQLSESPYRAQRGALQRAEGVATYDGIQTSEQKQPYEHLVLTTCTFGMLGSDFLHGRNTASFLQGYIQYALAQEHAFDV